MTNHMQALDTLLHTRHAKPQRMDSRKIANNTVLRRLEDDDGGRTFRGYAMRLHDTDVAVFHPDNTLTLRTGGWWTVTTKDRINTALSHFGPAQVASDKGVWYLYRVRDGWTRLARFFDGMRLDRDLRVVNPEDGPDFDARDERNAELKRKIRAYLDGFTPDQFLRLAREGSAGDCWYCLMRTQEGQPLGDATGGHSHLEDHLDEGYYMISLTHNALADKGYPSPTTILWLAQRDAEAGRTDSGSTLSRVIKPALRRYFERRLYEGRATK